MGLADHQGARRRRATLPRSPVRHPGRVPEVPGSGHQRGRALRAVPQHGADNHRWGGLAMASGRPHRPNDPSVMASVESALSSVARPGLLARLWHWRYEAGLLCGLAAVVLASGYALGAVWLIALMATGLGLLAASLSWAPTRQRLIARAWCVITPHRVRTGCAHAWVQSRDGRLPVVLYTTRADFGERVTLWCRAGITAGDLIAARGILRSVFSARHATVVASRR